MVFPSDAAVAVDAGRYARSDREIKRPGKSKDWGRLPTSTNLPKYVANLQSNMMTMVRSKGLDYNNKYS